MRINKTVLSVVFFAFLFSCLGCKTKPIDCNDLKISIENRWSDKNGGLKYIQINDRDDVSFICKRINGFSKGKDVMINYSYGDIDITINNIKIQSIFTYRNGVVYRVSPGKYVYDEALTKRILKIMKIKKRCWGEDFK